MNSNNIKRTVCAALAGLMLALTGCSEAAESGSAVGGASSSQAAVTTQDILTPDEPTPDETSSDPRISTRPTAIMRQSFSA